MSLASLRHTFVVWLFLRRWLIRSQWLLLSDLGLVGETYLKLQHELGEGVDQLDRRLEILGYLIWHDNSQVVIIAVGVRPCNTSHEALAVL